MKECTLPGDDIEIRKQSRQGPFPRGINISSIDTAIKKARDYLLSIQNHKGYWVGELEADVTVAAGYIPLMYCMTGKVDEERQNKIIAYVKSKQKTDGSWSTYYGGDGDLNVTIQAYFALKLAGISPEEEFMRRACEFVLANGGITRSSTLTKIWLAIFGQFDWRGTPSLLPEVILLPDWFLFNIYEFASWSRATIVALMVVLTQKPVCKVPESAGTAELYVETESQRKYSPGKFDNLFSWKSFFLVIDRLFKIWNQLPFKPFRKLALKKTEEWIIEHQESDGSWGGIMLPWIYSLIALKCQGYALNHPVIAKGMGGLTGFIMEDSSTFRLQPATSPVWDTAWAVVALYESGLPDDHPAMIGAGRWLLDEEVRVSGDWRVKNRHVSPGCWSFEFDNDLYPDIDDTAVVPRALLRVRFQNSENEHKVGAIERGTAWVIGMQSDNGGWAAFDRNNNMEILAHVPFADFMTPLDPTSPDVTAHVMEMLGELGINNSRLKQSISYIKREQKVDGSWYGRWGVNYLYGTGLVLAGLRAMGEDMAQDYVGRAVSWLFSCQHEDGGWGETCQTYNQPSLKGIGPSTASQTAWALIGLIAAGKGDTLAVERGIDYLLDNQGDDGDWKEEAYTGSGFPKAFYLRYDLYRIYFPLLAIAQYRNSLKEDSDD